MRVLFALALLALVAGCLDPPAPPPATGQNFDEGFDGTHDLVGWQSFEGEWELVDEPTAPSQPHALEGVAADRRNATWFVASGRGTYGDGAFTVRLRLLSETDGAGLVLRHHSGFAHYLVGLQGGLVTASVVERGESRDLEEAFGPPFVPGRWHEVHVRLQGDRLHVRVDGAEAFSVRDPTSSVGHVGLWVRGPGGAQFDDFSVRRA